MLHVSYSVALYVCHVALVREENTLMHDPVMIKGQNYSIFLLVYSPCLSCAVNQLDKRSLPSKRDHLIGLVLRRPPRERKIPGSNPTCAEIFSGSSHTSDLKIGTPVATLPGAWRYRVNTGTGRPGVSIL